MTIFNINDVKPLKFKSHMINSFKIGILIAVFSMNFNVQGQLQEQLNQFNQDRLEKNKKLMLTLGGWSAVNLVSGGLGYIALDGTSQHFHQMNALWNTVNFSLAASGLMRYRKDKSAIFNLSETISEQHKTEKIFLVNSAIDISYIGAGAFLHYQSGLGGANASIQKGFGNALIVQGAFLLIFDVAAFYIHKKNRLKNLEPIVNSIGL
jgi:hypothetical protein